MWPWSHAAVGYLLYSFSARLVGRRPNGYPVIVLLFATQLPDLIDKPLSWVFDLFPQGYSIGHSIFIAVPLGVAVLAIAAWRHRIEAGIAFIIGYWSHLLGDILFALIESNPYAFERVLWPIVTLPSYSTELTGLERLEMYVSAFIYLLLTKEAVVLLILALLFYFGPFAFAFLVWIVDGTPGVATLRRFFSPST